MNAHPVLSKLKPKKELLQTLTVLLLTFLISAASLFLGYLLRIIAPEEYGLLHQQKEDLEITYKEILFFSSIVLAFFVLSVSYRHVKHRQFRLGLIILAATYLSASFLIILTDCVYYLIFTCRITFSAFQTILNTNPSEARNFAQLYYSYDKILMILLFISVLLLIIRKRRWFMSLFSSRIFFYASLFGSVAGILDFIQMAHSRGNGLHNMRYWDIVIGDYNEYREFNRRLEKEKSGHNLSGEYSHFYKADTLRKTFVFVISESLSKRHMSLYGYPRSTTPNLDTNTSLFKFNNSVTQAAITIEAVPGLFFNGHLSKKINLVTLCNKLGYETSWISNQSGWGKFDGSIVLLSQLCKNSFFTDSKSDGDKANASLHYDEELLAPFEKAISLPSSSSKFIVLHLMGCHFDYEKRYPAKAGVFRSEAPAPMAVNNDRTRTILNAYDNAMHYHDSVVNEILRIFTRHTADQTAALVFLSDHGEEIFDYRDHAGHGYPPTPASSEIPHFALLSPCFKKNYPSLASIMKTRTNTAFSTVSNFYSIVHLLNIGSKTYKHRILKNSFFSPLFDSIQPRMVAGINYDTMNF